MSEDNFERNIKISELFLKEDDIFDADHSNLWFDANEVLPVCSIDSRQLIMILAVNGLWQTDENDNSYNDLDSIKVSKLVLTFGGNESINSTNYEIGFFDGAKFRELSGYYIYPPPSHWMPFPKSPQIKK